jgi:hypothetical protein
MNEKRVISLFIHLFSNSISLVVAIESIKTASMLFEKAKKKKFKNKPSVPPYLHKTSVVLTLSEQFPSLRPSKGK